MTLRTSLGIGLKQRHKEKNKTSTETWEGLNYTHTEALSRSLALWKLLAGKPGAPWSPEEPGVSQPPLLSGSVTLGIISEPWFSHH